MVKIINEAKIYYAAGDRIPGNVYHVVGKVTRKEAEKIPKGITSIRIDEMLLRNFGSSLFNNELKVEQVGEEYLLKVHSDLEPEHKK